MKRIIMPVVFLLSILVMGTALAAANDTATVTYEVSAINEISVSGDPTDLVVDTATAGSQPDVETDATTTYAITTNETKKITGAINTAMPTGTTLKVNLAATVGGTSAGDVTLSDTAADLVTGVSKVAESAKTITYKFSATAAAGVLVSASKTVTFTIAAAS